MDPLDAGAWAKALVDLLESDEALRQLAAAGLARAALFTKERTAAVMLEVLAGATHSGRR